MGMPGVLPALSEKTTKYGQNGANNLRRPGDSTISNLSTMLGGDRTVLNEESFHRVISLERKRTERSNRPFLLMLLDIDGVLAGDKKGKGLPKIYAALSTSIRETDVIGLYKKNSVIGIMFTELGADSLKSIVNTIVGRISGILYCSLTFEEFRHINISYHIFPEAWDHDVPQRPSHPTLYPDVSRRENGSQLFSVIKRMMDITGSLLGLILCAPVFLAIAVAVKLSSKGPVFFRQRRVGLYGTPFVFLKFRSMHIGSDPQVHRQYVKQLIAGQAERQPSNGNRRAAVYKLTNDTRVTRVGEFLRRTSLDELPQLWNVLKGEMSLVGPRPAIPYEVEAYQIWHRRRVLEAKPGITGLWQVNGRSRVKFDDMVRLDVRYSLIRSVWLDLRILLLTPKAVILGEGAY
jgi:lipopolysaccharide/colanic/teichoic acid biosynthesis glycosyltransferase